jgi:hypothetical protein
MMMAVTTLANVMAVRGCVSSVVSDLVRGVFRQGFSSA